MVSVLLWLSLVHIYANFLYSVYDHLRHNCAISFSEYIQYTIYSRLYNILCVCRFITKMSSEEEKQKQMKDQLELGISLKC